LSELIEDYERQTAESEYQKQKLKQNVMLAMMSTQPQSQNNKYYKHDYSKTNDGTK
jgi:hypothetical protein